MGRTWTKMDKNWPVQGACWFIVTVGTGILREQTFPGIQCYFLKESGVVWRMSRTGPFQGHHKSFHRQEIWTWGWGNSLHASAVKMEEEYSFKTSVFIHKTKWCYNPEGHNLKIIIVKTSKLVGFVIVNSVIGASSGNSFFSLQGYTLLGGKCIIHINNGVLDML